MSSTVSEGAASARASPLDPVAMLPSHGRRHARRGDHFANSVHIRAPVSDTTELETPP